MTIKRIGQQEYQVSSKTTEGKTYHVFFSTTKNRWECNCEFVNYQGDNGKCNHIQRIEKYEGDPPKINDEIAETSLENISYDDQKEIAIESWNEASRINQEIEEFKEQYKESKESARESFVRSFNNMISILFDTGKVQSILQALMIIAADLQDRCIDFPKSDRGLSAHIDQDNIKRLLQKNVAKTDETLPTIDTEQSSIVEESEDESVGEQTTLTQTPIILTDLDLFQNVLVGNNPKPYTIWNYQLDHRFGLTYPGNIPAGVVFNTLYFFTKPGDLVVDPMSGGGVVGDCCKAVNRKCLMYDVSPIREDITKLDIASGLPKECKNAALVFWDPPYWKKKEDDYYDAASISGLSRKDYLETFADAAEDFAKKGIKKVALLMSDYLDYEDPTQSIYIWDYVKIFAKTGWRVLSHIHCPLSTEQVHNHANLIEQRRLWGLSRSLVIFQR